MNQNLNRRHILQGSAVALGLHVASPLMMAVTAFSESAAQEHSTKASIFSASERKMVEILAELIIPETDTPGAGAAGVPDFIDMMVSDWYAKSDKQSFIDGLRHLNHHCRVSFGGDFLAISTEQQIVALEDIEQNVSGTISDGQLGGKSERIAALHKDPALWGEHTPEGRTFFDEIKSITVLGYYTSEVGIDNELIYDPVPGSYDGSFDFHAVGKHYTS